MTAARQLPRHPSSAVLVRHLDGELDEVTAQRLRRHLRRCEQCGDRLRRYQKASAAAADQLREWQATVPVPDLARARARQAMRSAERTRPGVRLRRTGWLAAVLVGVVALGLTVEPVRAWVLQRIGTEGAVEMVAADPPRLPEVVVDGAGAVVSFPARAEQFTVHVERRQTTGELLLQALPLEQATVQVIGEGGAAVLVLPAALRIQNPASTGASYRITVPPAVRLIEVHVAGEPPLRLEVMGEGWSQRVPLGGD